jgi:5'-3' exonuclease
MKVPTTGTSVFSPIARTGTGAAATVTGAGFPPDLALINIAMDGVVNAGKQSQQRIRRFHSVCKRNRINKINQTFGNNLDSTTINNDLDMNMVSPGTTFMYKLSFAIKNALKTSQVFRNKTVIFSDSSLAGEGEHKILQHLKLANHLAIDGNANERQLYGSNHNIIIYGLDADLIHLSLINNNNTITSQQNTQSTPPTSKSHTNTYLFREANEYGNLASMYEGKKFLFMDISVLSETILKSFRKYSPDLNINHNNQNRHTHHNRHIDDYVFLSMILGNDFMPKNHWYSIYEGGYERLISAYFQIYNHREVFLVDSKSLQINTEMLTDIWFIIKGGEQDAICKLFDKRKKARIYIKPEMTERERQQMLTDFYPLQHLYIEQEIEPVKPNWRQRYYKICFNNMDNTPDNISMVCQAYLKTLVFNFLYYFDECPSWDWYYPYTYSPTFSDVYDELLKHKNINATSSNKIFNFKKSKPIDQQTLLFAVLPFASRNLMVKDAARQLLDPKCPMNIYFPKKYGINVAFHRYYHECTPIIYKIDMDKVKQFLKECKFTEDELRRNLVGDLFIMNS